MQGRLKERRHDNVEVCLSVRLNSSEEKLLSHIIKVKRKDRELR